MATLAIRDRKGNSGLAVNDDATLMAVSNAGTCHVTVYRLAVLTKLTNQELSCFGGNGRGESQFDYPRCLCFTVDDTLLVADFVNQRIQDMTVLGLYKRTIGEGVLEGSPVGVIASEDIIVVSQHDTDTQLIVVFDYRTGSFLRGFCDQGSTPGCLRNPAGLRLSPDRMNIIVAESYAGRLSVLTVTGELVCVIGSREDNGDLTDACYTSCGDIVTVGSGNQEIIVFSSDGSTVKSRFGSYGNDNGLFQYPCAVAYVQGRLYVLDEDSVRVQVFE